MHLSVYLKTPWIKSNRRFDSFFDRIGTKASIGDHEKSVILERSFFYVGLFVRLRK